MHSYLSIDLDYWRNEKNDHESTKVFKKVFSLGLPLYVVQTHEQLLSHINRSRYDVIYNVDYHSDIFGFHSKEERTKWIKDNPKPDEGQWGVFIKWRKRGCFHWMYPNRNCYVVNGHESVRNDVGACWESRKDNPYLPATYTDWKEIKRSIGLYYLDWDSVTEIGICVSPDWSKEETVKKVGKILECSFDKHLNWRPFFFDPNKVSFELLDTST